MEVGFGLVSAFIVCGFILASLKNEDNEKAEPDNRSDILYKSSNKDSYIKAGNLFKTLENAGVIPNFLGK